MNSIDARIASSALAILLCAVPSGAPAQQSTQPGLQPGTRVRVTHVLGPRHVGTLDSITRDTVRFTRADGVNFVLPASDVLVEQSLGQRRRFFRNFAVTTVVAAGVGATLGAATYEPCESTGFLSCLFAPGSHGEAALLGGLFGGVVGAPIGLVAGFSVKTDHWAPVEIRQTLSRLSIRPTLGRGVGFAGTYVLEWGAGP